MHSATTMHGHAYRRSHSDRSLDSEDEDESEQHISEPPPLFKTYSSPSQTSESSRTGLEGIEPLEDKNGLYRRKRGIDDLLRSSITIANDSPSTIIDAPKPTDKKTTWQQWADAWMQSHWHIPLVSFIIFAVLAGAGIALFLVIVANREEEQEDAAMDLAVETGAWFAKELDLAILPLFSMAQFATELELFAGLPDKIKSPGEPGALPFLPAPPDSNKVYRNITGVCDQPELIDRFVDIASTVKTNARMDGVLHNIQLAPQGM